MAATDFVTVLKENIAYYFGVPTECQAICDEDGLLRTVADFVRALQHTHPVFEVQDIRGMPAQPREHLDSSLACRVGAPAVEASDSGEDGALAPPEEEALSLHIECGGQHFDWDMSEFHDILDDGSLEYTLRENIAHYFGIPYEHQAIFDEDGPIQGAANFSRVFRSVCPGPRLRVMDKRLGGQATQPRFAWPPPLGTGTAPPPPLPGFGFGPAAGPSARWPVLQPSLQSSAGEIRYGPGGAGDAWSFQVSLARMPEGGGFGFVVGPAAGGVALLVSQVYELGVLATWNCLNPGSAIRAGDVILAVNGTSGDAAAMATCLMEDEVVTIIARRCCFGERCRVAHSMIGGESCPPP